MSRKKKPPTIFADTADGRLYVRVDAVMHPMVAMADGIQITTFGDDKHRVWWMAVDAAIEWCRREAASHSADEYALKIKVLEKAKAQAAEEQGSQP